MLRSCSRAIGAALCVLVALAAPGPSAYAAAARAFEAPQAPMRLPALPTTALSAELSLPQAAPTNMAPAAALTATRAPVTAAAAAQAAEPAATRAAPAATLAQVQAAGAVRAPASSPEAAQADARRLFDDGIGPDAPAPVERTGLTTRVLAWTAAHPKLRLAAAAAAVLALSIHHPSLGGAAAPLLFGTCNSMRERQIKDATILPEQKDKQEAAKKELDAILVEFGKRLKALAEQDARIGSNPSAHTGEHGMEEPILEVLPQLKERWAKGDGPTKQEALALLRAEVLEHLKEDALKSESPRLIEELLNKTGSWEDLLAWESRHGVLDALKKAAQKEAGHDQDKTRERTNEDRGGLSGAGGATLGVVLLAAAAFGFHALGLGLGLTAGLAFLAGTVAQPAPTAVPLDSYLAQLGLSKEDADFLKGFTIDLGARDIAPVIGRSKELRRVITILSKPAGTQNNPMILGDKGVGKTAIVEAVAKYLYNDRLPSLKGKRILELDTGRLAAGTGRVGEMEERLTKLRAILAKTNNKVVLFVDEIHSILKNVATSNAVPDLLKSPLRNGEITVIGATTVGEYRKYVETDPAFADRFDPVQVDEPAVDEAVEMLEGDLEYLERKFQVSIDPEAAKAAVKLSARYIPEKFLPRKARVLLEAAIAEAKPEAARDGVQVQIDQLTDRLRIFVKRYAALRAANDASRKADETELYNRIVSLYTTILSLDEKSRSFVDERIGKDHVMRTLAKETGIQLGDLGEDEYKRLLRMEPWFKDRIVGQDDAIKALADTVRTNKSGLSDPNRPQGVFLFAGKTGVGKTALARTLAEFLFGNPDAVTRLDMSEYMDKFSVGRMFGAPPGYVGYDQGGQLTEAVRRQPYSVVLLDEIEKAHPDVLNALLQVFDAGRMTDGRGNVVNFKNTIIIMTSNLGASSAAQGRAFKDDVAATIRQRLKPEFVNRVDKIVVFNPLELTQAESILRIMLKDVQKRLREQDLELRVSPEAVDLMARKGFDADFGARPLKRVVESDVTNSLSGFLLGKKAEGELVNGGVVEVGVKDGMLTFGLEPNPAPVLEPTPLPEGPLGEKLRRILEEAVRDSGATKDAAAFEDLLFPERRATPPSELVKAEADSQQPSAEAGSSGQLEAGAPGVKDPRLAALKAEVAAKLSPLYADAREGEALSAWLDAFSRLAKTLFPGRPLRAEIPVSSSRAVAQLIVSGADTGEATTRALAKIIGDNMAKPLPDEAAVRAAAAQLKDRGVAPELDLIDLSRLVPSIPGAQMGYAAKDGAWRFWLDLPLKSSAAPAAAPAGPGAPISALDARLSPAKMFLFLTQGAPDALRGRRELAAQLLDAKTTPARLAGLHMAAAMLDASAVREVAAASRMIRLADLKDYALFSSLAASLPGVPMTAQRQALAQAYESSLQTLREEARRTDYTVRNTDTLLYSALAAPVLAEPNPRETANALRGLRRIRNRYRRFLGRFAFFGLLGEGFLVWSLTAARWHLAGLIIAPMVVALILLWICLANAGDRSIIAQNAGVYEEALTPRLLAAQRERLALRRLDVVSRGGGRETTLESEADRLAPALGRMSPAGRARLFARWRSLLAKGLERQRSRPRAEAKVFATLGLLARLLPLAPDSERAAIQPLLLEPLRRRWLPPGGNDYLSGLGAWLARAPMSTAELEDVTGLVVNVPANAQASTDSFLPVYRGLAGRADLPADLKAALQQFLAGLSAEIPGSNGAQLLTLVELARLRAKLGYPRQAWSSLQEPLSRMDLRNFVNYSGAFSSLDQLIQEAPARPEEQRWLIPALKRAQEQGSWAELSAAASLPLARLVKDDAERLALLVSGLANAPVDNKDRADLAGELLQALRAASAAPLSNPETAGAFQAAVRENQSRLSSADAR